MLNTSHGKLFHFLFYKASILILISSAWVTAMASGSMHAFGMISAFLGNRLGFANVIVLGGVVCTVGMVSSSFATNVYLLYLTYGLVWGFGSCLCYCSALFLLPQFFRARLGLANGIVFLGAPVGTLVYSVLIQKLLSYMGLAKSFRVLAGVQLVLVLCGLQDRLFHLGLTKLSSKLSRKPVLIGRYSRTKASWFLWCLCSYLCPVTWFLMCIW